MKINNPQPSLFDKVRPRFITTNTSEEYRQTLHRLQAQGHFIPTVSRGKHNAQWIIEVCYRDE